jgi:SAM-dependent methyltransferase
VGGVDRIPSPSDLDRYYSGEFRLRMGKMVGLDAYLKSGFYKSRAASVAAWIRPEMSRPVREWLDIGAGYGLQLQAVKDRFPRARRVAVEPSQKAKDDLLRVAHQVAADLSDLEGTTAFSAPDGRRVASAIHVLEHVRDPAGLLRSLGRWLRPGGELIIEVPNDHLDEMLSATRTSDLPHLWFFSQSGLIALVAHSGFRVERVAEVGPSRTRVRPTYFSRLRNKAKKVILGRLGSRGISRLYGEGAGRASIRVLATQGD